MNKIIKIFKPWFFVDSRALGIFRILLGVLCFIDIYRRFEFIDIFYTNDSIISISTSNSFYKSFTLLRTFTSSWEVHIFFIIGLITSTLLLIGYRTKLSQFITTIIIISIHNRAIMLENAGDFMFNNILIISLFLPLGISFGIDSLKTSLNFKEFNFKDLNDKKNGINIPKQVFTLGYFAMLIQLSIIYFFTGFNKSGYDWENGSAVYKMLQLDTFLTPVGYFLRDYITAPISEFFTYTTLTIELLAPLILFFPFYNYIFRLFFIFCFFIFHISIRSLIKVGLFSFTMISTYVLLIDEKVFNKVKMVLKNKFFTNKYILFYDADCGFCHYTCRIIKRIDVFNLITFSDGKNYKDDNPKKLNELLNKTAVLFNPITKKQWIKHQVFGKILFLIPFGFLFAWIFFIPYIEIAFGKAYDFIAFNRTKISKFFGLPACNLKNNSKFEFIKTNSNPSKIKNITNKILIFFNSIMASIIIVSSINYSLVANESVNKYMAKNGFEKFQYNKTFRRILSYPRMIQRWNMFSPTVLGTDKTVIVEATLTNGEVIDPFRGETPILDNLDYPSLWHDHNQFWRKFFSRVTKKQNSKHVKSFEKWLKKYNNTYFDDILDGEKIKSVKIWSLSQKNSNINSTKEYKVNKKLLNKESNSSSNSKNPPKKKSSKKIPPKPYSIK